jgi:hypothetical protein
LIPSPDADKEALLKDGNWRFIFSIPILMSVMGILSIKFKYNSPSLK